MMSKFDVKGKVALVTGGSSGLGRQFALALAQEGANVAIVARRMEKLEAVKAEIEALGVECFAHKCDVTKPEDIAVTVQAVKEHFGRIDILVNNAGVGSDEWAIEMSDDLWNRTIATNLNGVFFFARETGKVMVEQNYGKVINIASIHGLVGSRYYANIAYASTKGAVINMTRQLAAEWAAHNITVNAIAPGYFGTDINKEYMESDPVGYERITEPCPMNRLGKPGELDGALMYFASEASSFTTGQTLFVDGGWTII